MTALRLARRRKDRLGQPIGLAQPRGQPKAAHLAGRDVILPAGTRQVSARDTFNRQRLGFLHEHRAAAKRVHSRLGLWRISRRIGREEMIGDDRPRAVEPERRYLGEDLALVGNSRAQNVIER